MRQIKNQGENENINHAQYGPHPGGSDVWAAARIKDAEQALNNDNRQLNVITLLP